MSTLVLVRIPVEGYIEMELERPHAFVELTDDEIDEVLGAGEFILEDHNPLGATIQKVTW